MRHAVCTPTKERMFHFEWSYRQTRVGQIIAGSSLNLLSFQKKKKITQHVPPNAIMFHCTASTTSFQFVCVFFSFIFIKLFFNLLYSCAFIHIFLSYSGFSRFNFINSIKRRNENESKQCVQAKYLRRTYLEMSNSVATLIGYKIMQTKFSSTWMNWIDKCKWNL